MTSTDPFAAPASTAGIDYKELQGSLLLISVHGVEEKVVTKLGEKDAVRADVAVLDGDSAGEEITDALIFPRVLQGQLRSRVGQKVLGRLGQGVARAGQNAPWVLAEATEDDKKLGRNYLSGQFSTPTPDQPPF